MRIRTRRRLVLAAALVAVAAAAVISGVMLNEGGTAGTAGDEGEFPTAFSRHLEQLKKTSPAAWPRRRDPRAS